MKFSKNGQVWIETVIYTLVAIALIGLVLAFATPKINKDKDKAVVEQTIDSLNKFDSKIQDSLGTPGNRRVVDFTMKRGELYIVSEDNKIVFVLNDLSEPYSEPGIDVEIGRIVARSAKGQKYSSINLTLSYDSLADITFNGKEETKKFNPSSVP